MVDELRCGDQVSSAFPRGFGPVYDRFLNGNINAPKIDTVINAEISKLLGCVTKAMCYEF
jgi:hypothetical protein